MTDNVITITDKDKALTFIRRAACDGSITADVSLTNKSIDALSAAEARALLAANGMEVAEGVEIKFVVDTADTMYVRIPYFGNVPNYPDGQADPVADAKPGAGGDKLADEMAVYEYQHAMLGDIYRGAYGGSYPTGGADKVVEFSNARLLDYAISNCK